MNVRTMPIMILTALAGSALGVAVALAQELTNPEAAPPAPVRAAPSAEAQRGAYLVRIMACNDCHTPWTMGPSGPEPDMSRELSGHPENLAVPDPPAPSASSPWTWSGSQTNTAFAGPWGVSFTANLTPDPETGLGTWDADTFLRAIRTGRHEGRGRPILPPMPWPQYRNASDEDLRAVFAYLRSLRPIRNRVPQPVEPAEPASPTAIAASQ